MIQTDLKVGYFRDSAASPAGAMSGYVLGNRGANQNSALRCRRISQQRGRRRRDFKDEGSIHLFELHAVLNRPKEY
jgi:hypothetical protein